MAEEKQDSAEARAFQRKQQNISASEAPWAGPSSVSEIDIESVKDLVQVYLQQGKHRYEVATILSDQKGIPPQITDRAWNRLKEEKPELFDDYVEMLVLRHFSKQSLDQQHNLPSAKSPPLTPTNPGFSQNMLDGGDTIPLQLQIPSVNLQSVPCRQFVNDENPTSGSFHPSQDESWQRVGDGRQCT